MKIENGPLNAISPRNRTSAPIIQARAAGLMNNSANPPTGRIHWTLVIVPISSKPIGTMTIARARTGLDGSSSLGEVTSQTTASVAAIET